MFCKKCGTNLADDSLFCENCGMPVRQAESAPAEPVSPVPPMPPVFEERPPVSIPVQPVTPVWEQPTFEKPKKSSAKWLIPVVIAAAAVVVAAIIAVLLLLGGGGGSSEEFYHEMNFNNVAYFAYDDNRLYFVAEYNDDAEDTSLYSTDHNGINKKMISDNGDIIRIRVVDGKIYYLESTDDVYNVGVMDTDGSNDRVIVTTENLVDKYAVRDGKLFYLTDDQLFVCDLNGGDSKLLVEGASTFVVGDGVLYYASEDVISAFDLKKENSKQLCKAEGAADLALNGNTLYFACDTGLNTVDVKGDGSVKRLISDSEMDSYVVYGDYIYYCHEFTTDEIAEIAEYLATDSSSVLTYKLLFIGTGTLYRANMDGSNAQKVENSDISVVFALYTSPKDLYYKMTAFSDNIEPVEFE